MYTYARTMKHMLHIYDKYALRYNFTFWRKSFVEEK